MTLSATPRISVTAGCHRPPAWGEAVRILTACVLLLASGLKGYQLSTEPVLSGDLSAIPLGCSEQPLLSDNPIVVPVGLTLTIEAGTMIPIEGVSLRPTPLRSC